MGDAFARPRHRRPAAASRVGVAALAGLVSFLSPCVLPLVPGYLSYVTGLVGADLAATPRPTGRDRRRPAATRRASGAARDGRSARCCSSPGSPWSSSLTACRRSAGWAGCCSSTSGPSRSVLGVLIIVLGLALPRLVPGLQRECADPPAARRRAGRRAGARRRLRAWAGRRASARPSARCSRWPPPSGAAGRGGGARPSPTASGWACRSCSSALGLPPAARAVHARSAATAAG